jgi:hypothetical protein
MKLPSPNSPALLLALSLVALAAPPDARAAWDPAGEPVPVADCGIPLLSCTDDQGGLYTFWQKVVFSSPPVVQIVAQHLRPDGSAAPGWPVDGKVVTGVESDAPTAGALAVAPDDAGGAYLWWRECRFILMPVPMQHRLFRMQADGSLHPAWPDSGLVLGREAYTGSGAIAPDGPGGVYVGLVDDLRYEVFSGLSGLRIARIRELRLTRVGAGGTLAPGWPSEGVLVRGVAPESLAFEPHSGLDLLADAQGGALLACADSSDGLALTRLWRYGSAGAPQGGWPAEGVSFTSTELYTLPGLASDGLGGVYVSWNDSLPYSGGFGAPRLQHLGGDGSAFAGWPAAGLAPAGGDLQYRFIGGLAPDGAGGVYAQTEELTPPSAELVRLQHFTANAGPAPGWSAQGILLDAGGGGPVGINQPVAGAGGGVHATWGMGEAAQLAHVRVAFDGSEVPGWSAAAPRTIAMPAHRYGATVAADGLGTAYVSWGSSDPFACEAVAWQLGVRPNEAASVPPPGAPSGLELSTGPNPSAGSVDIALTLARPSSVALEVFEPGGRRVFAWRATLGPGAHQVTWDGRTDSGEAVSPGIYFVTARAGSDQANRRVAILR